MLADVNNPLIIQAFPRFGQIPPSNQIELMDELSTKIQKASINSIGAEVRQIRTGI